MQGGKTYSVFLELKKPHEKEYAGCLKSAIEIDSVEGGGNN